MTLLTYVVRVRSTKVPLEIADSNEAETKPSDRSGKTGSVVYTVSAKLIKGIDY